MKSITNFLVLSVACCAAAIARDDSKVLVTMDGKPVITQQQLEQALKKNPDEKKIHF